MKNKLIAMVILMITINLVFASCTFATSIEFVNGTDVADNKAVQKDTSTKKEKNPAKPNKGTDGKDTGTDTTTGKDKDESQGDDLGVGTGTESDPVEDSNLGNGFDVNILETINNEHLTRVEYAADRIWNTTILILQIASITGIIIAGIRYMFMSADRRADIKNNLIYLVIGMVFVFSASTVAGFIRNVFAEATKEPGTTNPNTNPGHIMEQLKK